MIIGAAGNLVDLATPQTETAMTAADSTERLSLEAYALRSTKTYQSLPLRHAAWLRTTARPGIDADVNQLGPRASGFSDFMIGSIAYAIVFVDGGKNLGFNNEEKKYATAYVQEALSWFAEKEPRADLTFYPEIEHIEIRTTQCPSCLSLEALEAVWRDPVLAKLGLQMGIAGVEEYASSVRQRNRTDWAFVLFFTKYSIGGTEDDAYAAAPRVVVRIHDDVLADENFALVIAHEIGHLFGCPDEYQGSCHVNDRSGFLNIENGNCQTTDEPPPEKCVMLHATDDMCQFTRLQLGWRDSDGDSILDPLEIPTNIAVTVSVTIQDV